MGTGVEGIVMLAIARMGWCGGRAFCCGGRYGLGISNAHMMQFISSQSCSDITIKLWRAWDCCIKLSRMLLDCSRRLEVLIVAWQWAWWQGASATAKFVLRSQGEEVSRVGMVTG